VPKITPACYFYARLKILLQNSLHVSLMRPRKKNTKIISQCLCPAHYYKKNCQKLLVKAQNHYVTSTQYFTIPEKNQIIEPTILYAISIYILYWSLLYNLFSIWDTFYCFLGDIMGEISIKVFVPKLSSPKINFIITSNETKESWGQIFLFEIFKHS
jgi:hypothetical protein